METNRNDENFNIEDLKELERRVKEGELNPSIKKNQNEISYDSKTFCYLFKKEGFLQNREGLLISKDGGLNIAIEIAFNNFIKPFEPKKNKM